MDQPTPIRLTLYNPETNEVARELSRVYLPWKLLKTCVELNEAHKLDSEASLTSDSIEILESLVCEVFNNQITPKDLQDGADMVEVLTVYNAIMTRAYMAMPPANPTTAGKTRQGGNRKR